MAGSLYKNFLFLYKMLEQHLWNSFLLYLVVEILQLVNEISSFQEVLYKRNVLKTFAKFTDKHKKQQKNISAGVSLLMKLQAGNLKLSEVATRDVL